MPPTPRKENPGYRLHEALQGAKKGAMPEFGKDELMKQLRLDGDTPDGSKLMDRLLGPKGLRFRDLRSVFYLICHDIPELVEATNERTANPAQEAIAQMLGAAVTQQIMRESTVCTSAARIALTSTRPDIISTDVLLLVNEAVDRH